MAKPYLQSIHATNYRVLKDLALSGCRRINVIGGLNSTGKTTLLEAIFTFMDRGNVENVIRPLPWRQLPRTLTFAHRFVFSDNTDNMTLRGETRDGKAEVNFLWGPISFPQTSSLELSPSNQLSFSNAFSEGLTTQITHGGRVVLKRSSADQLGGVVVNDQVNVPEQPPPSAMLSRYTMNLGTDLADRFSKIAGEGRKREIVRLASMLNEDVIDVELLQIDGKGVLHVETKEEALIPAVLAGDGVLTMLAIGMAIIASPRGILLLDEFDASIHFSRLRDTWRTISRLSREYECQVFAATHSRECIDAAVEGVEDDGASSDLAYFRLDRVDGKIVATKYLYDELLNAGREHWEIR